MTEQSTLLTLLLVRLETDRRPSLNGCRWTAADTDAKIFAFVHLCK